jgi:hypothetical protein
MNQMTNMTTVHRAGMLIAGRMLPHAPGDIPATDIA